MIPADKGVSTGSVNGKIRSDARSKILLIAGQSSFKPDARKWSRLDGADNPHKLSLQPGDPDFDKLIEKNRSTRQ